MLNIIRTNALHADFIALVKKLDTDLAERDGTEHSFYAQFNTITPIKFAVVVYENNIAIGCGAIKTYDDYCMEIKRMFVEPAQRGKGIATIILNELEKWVKELSYSKCILETGKRQPEAIALYQKNGYHIIPNYGQYIGMENSVCFKKELK
jgi:GNAT superfamily N-acetyltransferase